MRALWFVAALLLPVCALAGGVGYTPAVPAIPNATVLGNNSGMTASPSAVPVSSGSITYYGPLTSTATNLSTLNSALALAGVGGSITIDKILNIGTAPATNTGVQLTGNQGVFYAPTATGSGGFTAGNVSMNLPGRDWYSLSWGQEELFHFTNLLNAGSAIKIAVIGDSNTALYAGPALVTLLGKLPNTTVVNYGVSGSDFGNWVNNTGTVNGTAKNMAVVLATNPDLIVDLYGGTNDPYLGGTPATFYSDKAAGYATIRATSVQALSIIMMTAGPMGTGLLNSGATYTQDEAFNQAIRPYIELLAQNNNAAFCDKNGKFPDATMDFISGSGQNTWLDPVRVHAQGSQIPMMAQWMFECIVPSTFRVGNAPILGTAATLNYGTSGNVVPVLNGAATTWSNSAAFPAMTVGPYITMNQTTQPLTVTQTSNGIIDVLINNPSAGAAAAVDYILQTNTTDFDIAATSSAYSGGGLGSIPNALELINRNASGPIVLKAGGTADTNTREELTPAGSCFSFGVCTPAAYVTLGAGTATAGHAPLLLTSGVNTTIAVAGQVEYDGTNFYGTSAGPFRAAFLRAGDTNTLLASSGGTKFTTSGCSVSSTTGGATAGIFTLGANNCTVVVTMNGATGLTAPNGWSCSAHDRTTIADLISGETSSTQTTASIVVPVTAGATDVISFACSAY